ncbi:MAG: helix-turn-helix domain-containing protein [Bacteriovoracia bacterium]
MDKDLISKTLSKNLKAIRRSKGLTTTDLAKVLGVSQAKVSYIEHCKGVLSARDIAVLARRLDVPVIEFFRGLDKSEDASDSRDLIRQLVHYGANHLAKPPGISLKEKPFEEVLSQALGFIEDERLHQGFCAALIRQAATKEINVDRIFALIGNNPFLVGRIIDEVLICLKIVKILNRDEEFILPRATLQLEQILTVAKNLLGVSARGTASPSPSEISGLASFVKDCLHAKK